MEPSLPSAARMAFNATNAAARLAAAVLRGEPTEASKEEQAMRWDVCKACPLFRPSDKRCADCGCWLDAKIPLAPEFCGLLKWPGDLEKSLEDL
jgi:hypothetical protein